jgi:hypothetical protein
MPARSPWSVDEPRTLAPDEPVTAVQPRIAGRTVRPVGTGLGGPARPEVTSVPGPVARPRRAPRRDEPYPEPADGTRGPDGPGRLDSPDGRVL